MKLVKSVLIATVVGLSPALHAADFKAVQKDKSSLTFAYTQMGVGMTGHFNRFNVDMHFDPAKPAGAKADITVDLASIDTGSAEANGEVGGKQWFNTRQYPTARFVSGGVRSLGGNRYEIEGSLTLKGRTQGLKVPVTITVQGAAAAFDGALVIKRADFAIGEGPWADFGTVANEVKIKFHVVATRNNQP